MYRHTHKNAMFILMSVTVLGMVLACGTAILLEYFVGILRVHDLYKS